MSTAKSVVRICRACEQRSASSLRSNVSSSQTTTRQQWTPSYSRALSTTTTRPIDNANYDPVSDSSPPLPESMLPSTPISGLEPPLQSEPVPRKFFNPFKLLTPSSEGRTTIGTVSRIHTNTAYVQRNELAWDKRLQKYYNRTDHTLVHDPTSLLHVGDVIKYSTFTPYMIARREKRQKQVLKDLETNGVNTSRGDKVTKKGYLVPEGKRLVMVGAKLEAINKKQRNSKGINFVVREVVTPFGNSVEQRMTEIKPAGWFAENYERGKLAQEQAELKVWRKKRASVIMALNLQESELIKLSKKLLGKSKHRELWKKLMAGILEEMKS